MVSVVCYREVGNDNDSKNISSKDLVKSSNKSGNENAKEARKGVLLLPQ